jgi:microcystin-dependent protein
MEPTNIFILVSVITVVAVIIYLMIRKEKFVPAIWEQHGPYNCSSNPSNGTVGCPSYMGTDTSTTLSQAPASPIGMLTVTADGTISSSLNSTLPIGSIIAWAGFGVPPSGWAICNGQRVVTNNNTPFYTPDLTGRFLIGAGQSAAQTTTDERSTYQVGDFGGEEVHKLTVEEIPSHTHGGLNWGGGPGYGGGDNGIGGSTAEIGGNMPHNNLPPYYAILYIIKYM